MKLNKLPVKKTVTIDDILSVDSVNELLEDTIKKKTKIDRMIIITVEGEMVHWNATFNSISEMVLLLEQVKLGTLREDD